MRKFSFVFFLFLFITEFGYAQKTNHFDYYLSEGFKYHDNRKLDSSRYFLHKADSLVKLSTKDSTKFYRKELLKASLFVRENKIPDAIGKLLKANHFFKTAKDSANIGLSLYKLAVANYYLNRRLVARKYFKKTLPYQDHITKRLVTRIHQNFGTINLEEGMINKNDSLKLESIKNYKNAIKIYKEENWLMEQTLATSLLAESYNQLGNFNKALLIINEAITLAKKDKNKSQLGFALIKKTAFLGNKKRYLEALKTIKIAKPIFKQLADYPTYLYALNEEKKILIGLNRYKEATVIGDSIFQTSVKSYDLRFTDKVAEMDAKYKTAAKEKEIAIQKEEILENQLKIKNRNLFAILLSASLLILIILSFGYYYRSQLIKKQLQKEIDLKDALATIKTQNRLQEQRLRISRDLHDNIGSQLTFIISSVDNLKFISKNGNNILQEKLTSISSFTADTIFQLRDTIWAMNKNEISIEDFSARVLSYIEKAKKATQNSIHFKTRSKVDATIKFSSIIGINLFRALQEAINNAVKYANPETIYVNVIQKENDLIITIKDNGIGFNLTEVETGNGLQNMEQRISKIGGKIFVNSKLNDGTTIKIILPLKNTTNAV